MRKTNRDLSDSRCFDVHSLVCLVLFVYAFIPFESDAEGLVLQLRSLIAILFVGHVFVSAKWRFDFITLAILAAGFLMAVLAAIVSYSNRFFIQIISMFLGAVIACAARDDNLFRTRLAFVIEFVLTVSSIALLLQVVVWQATGEIIKIHEIIFPISEARVEDHELFARMGGMYIEPGTFSNWSCLFVVIYRFLIHRPKNWLMFLVGGAMIASLSAWGVAAGVTIISLSMFESFRRGDFSVLPLVIGVVVIASFLLGGDVLDFFETKSSLESASGDSKLIALAEFRQIFGDILLLGQGFAPDFCKACLAPQDVGVLIGFSVVFGVFFAGVVFLFFLIGVARKLGISGIFVGVFVAFSKVFYWDFVLWTLLFLAWLPKAKKMS